MPKQCGAASLWNHLTFFICFLGGFFFLATHLVAWDLSSPSRDRTRALGSERMET